jgi:hypothetical protein
MLNKNDYKFLERHMPMHPLKLDATEKDEENCMRGFIVVIFTKYSKTPI